MQAVAGFRRKSAMALAVMLLGALVAVPPSVAQGGEARTGETRAARRSSAFWRSAPVRRENANPVLLGFGPIHAKGVDREVGNHKDVFRFPRGSLSSGISGSRGTTTTTRQPACSRSSSAAPTRWCAAPATTPGRTGTVTTSCTGRSSPARTSLQTRPYSRSGRTVRCGSRLGPAFSHTMGVVDRLSDSSTQREKVCLPELRGSARPEPSCSQPKRSPCNSCSR